MRPVTSKHQKCTTAFEITMSFCFSLGMQHDGTGNACGGSSRIMAPSVGGQAENFLWSTCSAQYLQSFLKYKNYMMQKAIKLMYVMSYCIALDLQHAWMMYQPAHNLTWTLMNLLG